MLGEMVCELRGKVTGRRILPHEGMIKIELSTDASGKVLGIEAIDMTTFENIMKPGGIIFGMGQGAIMGKGGEMGMYYVNGVGKMTGKGTGATFRGALYMMSQTPKWSALNGIALIYEYETDENGNTHVKAWEWK